MGGAFQRWYRRLPPAMLRLSAERGGLFQGYLHPPVHVVQALKAVKPGGRLFIRTHTPGGALGGRRLPPSWRGALCRNAKFVEVGGSCWGRRCPPPQTGGYPGLLPEAFQALFRCAVLRLEEIVVWPVSARAPAVLGLKVLGDVLSEGEVG
jgi:hypothetical protein